MSSVTWAFTGTLFPFLMTLTGAGSVFLFKRQALQQKSALFLHFAGGVMLASSVFSLILPAIDKTTDSPFFPLLIGMAAGAFFLLMLEPFAHRGFFRQFPGTSALKGASAMTFLSITLHNIPEGMAVGLSFALAAKGEIPLMSAVTLALGIGFQNLPEGAAVALPLCRDGISRFRAFLMGAFSGVMEPLAGVMAALLLSRAQMLLPWMMHFSAGAMIYVTFREVLTARQETHSPLPALCAFLGFLLMTVMDVMLG